MLNIYDLHRNPKVVSKNGYFFFNIQLNKKIDFHGSQAIQNK